MIRWSLAWLATAIVFVGLDATWLTAMGGALYRPILGPILAARPRLIPAILFYLVYVGGVVVIAVRPALRSGSLRLAATGGAALGFVAYATYDLTSQATLAVWSTRLTVLDLAWGTFVTAAGASAGYGAGWLISRR